MDTAALALFIPTFFFVSITPGMCMTLALTLGMTIGVKRTGWMMIGELMGVALVSTSAVVGVAAVVLKYPQAFIVMKTCGALYLAWVGVQMWRSRGKLAIPEQLDVPPQISRKSLLSQGFLTAVANPKGWAFDIALLPPFVNESQPLAPQLLVLVSLILVFELVCMLLYASGGKTLRHLLLRPTNVRLMNRIAGSLMIGVGVWLFAG
ncbi:LysE family translocator [Neiella marina]|uniref:LysE family translocator n=1 Tax=Neiella holothuriorum TaxID=2870530 RepID=A0ABS7EIR2_9GAMM|nr:LysE family translocator [Neiella holothuriorum]MBW8192243.1 LysE family translocator [Neiella holothuriorum]